MKGERNNANLSKKEFYHHQSEEEARQLGLA